MPKTLAIDFRKCTGCEACMLACSFQKEGAFSLARSRILLEKFEEDGVSIALFCQHCGNAPCVAVCPSRALQRDSVLGTVVVDESRCIGCRMCSQVCPFGVISYDVAKGIAYKCDLCAGDPKCVQVCIPGALSIVDADRPGSARARQAALRQVEAEKLAEGR